MKRTRWMLIYGIFLYIIWGISLMISPNGMGATVMGVFQHSHIDSKIVALLFILSSLLTFSGMFLKNSIYALIFCFPQQLLLLLNSLSCIECIFRQQYADGVTRPLSFILVDQLPFILACLIHFCAILDMCLFSEDKK